MITVIIDFYIRKAEEASFKNITSKNVLSRRNAVGNLKTDFFQEDDDFGHFVMIEIFDTQQNIDAYYRTAEHTAWKSTVGKMIDRVRGRDYEIISPDQRDLINL